MSPVALVGEKLAQQAIATSVLAANVTTTATSSGTATALVTLGPAGFEGGTYLVYLWAPAITKGTTSISVELWLDGVFNQSILNAYVNATNPTPVTLVSRVAIGPGSHTVTLRGFVDAGTGTLVAGAGTTGVAPNAVAFILAA